MYNANVPSIAGTDDSEDWNFTDDYRGRASNIFHNKMTNMLEISVSTWGTVDIFPGDILVLMFFGTVVENQYLMHQYQGYWMVKRVEHICSFNFFTKLTLIRSGIDTTMPTTLISAKDFGGRKAI